MLKFLLALFVALTLAACQTASPPVVEVEVPVVEAPTEPAEPTDEYAPLGTCPVVATILKVPPAPLASTTVQIRLGTPCAGPVPVLFRERILYLRNDPLGWTPIFEGLLYPGQAASFAIPYSRRADRFDWVDQRDGTVVASVQNGRFRQPW